MAYDFTAAVNAAKAFVERQENRENGGPVQSYKYPLVYPQQNGTLVVRPLFNPKSGQILRLVSRHEKIPCYRTYGVDCPICSMMQQVKDMTGQDPFGRTKASRSRGVSFAQYISSTYPISKGDNKGNLQMGDIIIFMYPWSVYQQLNMMIQACAQSPTGMDMAFCHANQGLIVQVNVDASWKYTVTNVPYMTIQTTQSDDEFMKMLDDLDDLNEQVVPSTITEEVDKQVREYTNGIYSQYVAPRVPQQGVPANTTPQNFSQIAQGVPQQTQVPAAPYAQQASQQVIQQNNPQTPPWENNTVQTPSGNPSCYGSHSPGAPKCMCCPAELTCIEASN